MITVAPLGMRGVLPAFIVGYEASRDDLETVVAPPFVLAIDQQAGGNAMSYPSVTGMVLRLEANLTYGSGDSAFLIRGFTAMAEAPDLKLLASEYPQLRALVGTWGENYSPQQLSSLQSCLRRYFPTPPFASGIEAFVRCAECNPLEYFRGWRTLSIASKAAMIEQGSEYAANDDAVFEEKSLSALGTVAEILGVTSPPRVFFLWENSD